MPKLLVEKGPLKGQSVLLKSAAQMVVGREPSCSMVIGDTNISRKHCEFALRGGVWFVKDLGSRNGTYVNGKRIQSEIKLSMGDRLQVGETLLSFLDEKEGKNEGGLIGQRIGGYRILERLGRGGMGTVYKANQIALNREIALKVLSPDLISEDIFKNLFIQEARAAAALNHPNIVQVHDVGVEAGLYYFSMEFMPNGSLHDLLTREGRVAPGRALRIAMDAAAGLSYAERKGIVHRDIKPENLMISEGGVIKIGDLGLAFNVEKQGELDDEVGVMGTPHYCAPEQVTRGKLDVRTDLYALGATMYRMLAGRPPFTGQTLKEILVKKVREKPAPLKEAVPGLPASVNDMVMQLLEKEPAKRPGSAEELRGRIEAVLPEVEGLGSAGGRSGGTTAYGSSTNLATTSGTVPATRTGVGAGGGLRFAALSLVLLAAAGALAWNRFHKKTPTDDGKGPPVVAGNGNGGPVEPSVQDRAWALLQEVEGFVEANPAALSTREGLNQVIRRYEEVCEKYETTPAAAAARREVSKWKEQLLAVLAREALGRAEAAYDEALTKFQGTLDGKHLEEVEPLFLDIVATYKGTEAAKDAQERIDGIHRKLESAGTAKDGWTRTYEEVTNLCRQRRYADALAGLRDFAVKYADTGWETRAEDELAIVEKQARDDFERLMTVDLQPLLDSKAWDAALKLLADSKGRYGLPDLEERLLESGEQVRALAAKVDVPPTQPDDAQILADALATASDLMRAWKFMEAMKGLKEARGKLTAEAARARLQAEHDDCEVMEIFRQALRAHANGNDRDESGLKTRAYRGAKINGATDSGLLLDSGGELPWGKIAAADAFRLGMSGWTMSGRECLGVGILCIRGGYWRCARHVFSMARFRDPVLDGQAHLLIDRSEREEFSRAPTDPLAGKLYEMEQKEVKKAQEAADRMLVALAKAKDPKAQGEVYSGLQDFEQSSKYLRLALKEQDGLTGKDEWRIHWFLMTNSVMLGDDAGRTSHRFEASDRFPQPEYMTHIYQVDDMFKSMVPTLLRIDELRSTMRTRPDAATAIELLRLCEGKAYLPLETRVAARWVTGSADLRRGDWVKSGEPQRILAQVCLDMKDYVEAKTALEKLRRDHPTHEWCRAPENGQRLVDKEMLNCSYLIRKYSLTSPK